LTKSKEWKESFLGVLNSYNSDKKIKIQELIDMHTNGSMLMIPYENELYDIKQHIEKYYSWNNKFENIGITTGMISFIDPSDIIEEGKSLLVDVSDQLEAIISSSKAYCLCRQHYFGNMIGCDLCDDW